MDRRQNNEGISRMDTYMHIYVYTDIKASSFHRAGREEGRRGEPTNKYIEYICNGTWSVDSDQWAAGAHQ